LTEHTVASGLVRIGDISMTLIFLYFSFFSTRNSVGKTTKTKIWRYTFKFEFCKCLCSDGSLEQPFLDSSELMISQGLAHSQPSAVDPSRQAMLLHQSQGSGGAVSSGGLASHMLLQGGGSDSFNGSAGRTSQLPGLALSLDSMKPQVKRAAVGSAPSSGPPKKAPRLDIPEQGLHPGIQVLDACP
jgi:hypothetical protein